MNELTYDPTDEPQTAAGAFALGAQEGLEQVRQFFVDNLVDSPRKAEALRLVTTGFNKAVEAVDLYGVKPADEPLASDTDEGDVEGHGVGA